MYRMSIVLTLTVCMLAGGALAADVPQLLNYQGKLTDDLGDPMTGPVDLGFGFFDAPTAGTLLYYEEQTAVEVIDGIFHVLIGNGANQQGAFADIASTDTVYLEITSDPQGTPLVFVPRQQIVSCVFALKAGDADTVDGQHAADFEAADAALQADLDQEVADRIADVDTEQARAEAAEAVLQADLNQEIADRIADVDTEQARAEATEAALEARIAALEALPGTVREKIRLVHYPDELDITASRITALREGEVLTV